MSKDIQHGKVEIEDNELDLNRAKVRVNMWIDGDILEKVRKDAHEHGLKYQTYINKLLRDAVLGNEVKERLEALEKIVFSKIS